MKPPKPKKLKKLRVGDRFVIDGKVGTIQHMDKDSEQVIIQMTDQIFA